MAGHIFQIVLKTILSKAPTYRDDWRSAFLMGATIIWNRGPAALTLFNSTMGCSSSQCRGWYESRPPPDEGDHGAPNLIYNPRRLLSNLVEVQTALLVPPRSSSGLSQPQAGDLTGPQSSPGDCVPGMAPSTSLGVMLMTVSQCGRDDDHTSSLVKVDTWLRLSSRPHASMCFLMLRDLSAFCVWRLSAIRRVAGCRIQSLNDCTLLRRKATQIQKLAVTINHFGLLLLLHADIVHQNC